MVWSQKFRKSEISLDTGSDRKMQNSAASTSVPWAPPLAEVAGVIFSYSDSAPVPKFLNPGPEIFQICESDSCSNSSCNHRSNRILPMFLLKKWQHRLLLLPKLKVTPDTGPVFPKLLTPGPKKTQNPTGVDSGTPDPVPPLSSGSWFIAFWTVRLSFLWSDDSLCQTLNVCFLKKSQLSKSFMTPHFLHAKSLMIASRQVRSHWGKLPPSPFPKSCTKFFRLIGLKLLICEPKKYFSANQRNSLGILPFFSFLLNLITTVTETIRWHFY